MTNTSKAAVEHTIKAIEEMKAIWLSCRAVDLHDDCIFAIELLRALLAEREWRPIETAPKDGTSVFTMPHQRVTHYVDGVGWIFWHTSSEEYRALEPQPTHWQPLPTMEG
jgi:hypothetical protein